MVSFNGNYFVRYWFRLETDDVQSELMAEFNLPYKSLTNDKFQIPRVSGDAEAMKLFSSMARTGGGRFGSFGSTGGGRFGDSGFDRSGGFSDNRGGGQFGVSSPGRSSGRFGSPSYDRSGGSRDLNNSNRSGGFGRNFGGSSRSSGFGDFGSRRSGDTQSGQSSRSVRFGSFGDDSKKFF